jgi:hypothetical protein
MLLGIYTHAMEWLPQVFKGTRQMRFNPPPHTTSGEPSALTPTEKTFDSGAHYEGSDSYE